MIACARCPRLVRYRERIATEKKREFRDDEDRGRGVPGFGDPAARLVVGGSRPGRARLQPDRARLHGRPVGGVPRSRVPHRRVREPADFRPAERRPAVHGPLPYRRGPLRAAREPALPVERANCAPYLERELRLLTNARAILALGGFRLGGGSRGRRLVSTGPAPADDAVRARRLRPARSGSPLAVGLLPPQPSEHEHREADATDAGRAARTDPIRVRGPVPAATAALTGAGGSAEPWSEFELLERDGLARLGRFSTPHGRIETPALLPVVHPDPDRQPCPASGAPRPLRSPAR